MGHSYEDGLQAKGEEVGPHQDHKSVLQVGDKGSDSRATITDHQKWRSMKGVKMAPMKGIRMVLTKTTKTVKKKSGPKKATKDHQDKETVRKLIEKYRPAMVHLRID
jgi:hypothetical protein